MAKYTSPSPDSVPAGCPGQPLIEMLDIGKNFKTSAWEYTALKNINACFYQGQFVAVVGKSGSGKSTLANMITGIDRPSSGQVRIGGVETYTMNESEMAAWRGRNLGIVFQFFQLLPTLSVLENVMLPMDFCNMYSLPERETRARQLLEMVGLEAHAEDLPAALSGGQQQLAAIARALANDPPILIADEPTGNLDTRMADAVFDIFNNLVEQGKTILMVTHDSSLAQRTGRILVISDGELVDEGVAQALPHLPHGQMLWLTHNLQALSLAAGEPFYAPGNSRLGLVVVTGGALEVHLGADDHQASVWCIEPGQYFSDLELQSGGFLVQSVQGDAAQGAEVLVLEDDAFQAWLAANPGVQAGLRTAAEERVEQFAAWIDGAPGKDA